MNDLINRQSAINVLSIGKEILSHVLDTMDVIDTERENYSWCLGLIESCIKDIEALPSAQPIRCGECKHWNEEDGMCRILKEYVFNDDYFCSHAESKDGEADG